MIAALLPYVRVQAQGQQAAARHPRGPGLAQLRKRLQLRFEQKKAFAWVKRKVYPATARAVRDLELHLRQVKTDSMEELDHYGKKRIHNLKYYTWVEQQGKTYEEIQQQWYNDDYWESIPACVDQIDALIEEFNAKTGLLSNYYYQRGRGVLWRRVVDPDSVFDNPLSWPLSEAVAAGSRVTFDSGNVNATAIGDKHYLAFYSGKAPDTSILVSVLPAPPAGNSPISPALAPVGD